MAEHHQLRDLRDNLGHILAVWLGVTGIIITMVLVDVLPGISSWSSTAFVAYHYVLGPGLLVLIGVYVERRSDHPWIVAVGTVFLLWAAMSVALGCPGRACVKPDDYEYWKNIKLALDIGIVGPRLLVSTETGACAFQCPYKIQLIPLALGYGSLAFGFVDD